MMGAEGRRRTSPPCPLCLPDLCLPLLSSFLCPCTGGQRGAFPRAVSGERLGVNTKSFPCAFLEGEIGLAGLFPSRESKAAVTQESETGAGAPAPHCSWL